MGNLVTFAERFFEKDFTQMPLTEVDSLILCNLSYYEYENSIFEKNKFEETVQLYLQERPEGEIKGLVSVEKDKKLRESVSIPMKVPSVPRLARDESWDSMPSRWSLNHQAEPN